MNNEFFARNVRWGSRFFVNTQFMEKLLLLCTLYAQHSYNIKDIFAYIHFLQAQKKIKLYKELDLRIQEFITLEEMLTKEDEKTQSSLIQYVIWTTYLHFTGENLTFK